MRQNILAIQRGYIELISQTDLGLTGDSYPGFFLLTYDGLDIPEIKSPATELVSFDEATKTHAWSPRTPSRRWRITFSPLQPWATTCARR